MSAVAVAVTADHHRALQRAKVELMRRPDSVFFTTILFSLKVVWKESIRTAATDGRTIWLSPSFFMSLDPDERIFLLIHESQHVAYMHMERMLGRDKEDFNSAADYVINLQLVERGFKMPKVGLLNRDYAGLSTEQVYKILQALPKDQKPQPSWDDLVEAGDAAEEDQIRQEVQEIIVRAAIQSKMAGDKPGTIPGDIQIFLDRLLNPRLPWQRIVQKWFQAFDKNDYTMRRPNRRFMPDHYMPSLHGEKLMDFAVAVDVSGSVSDHEFNVTVSEIHAILRMFRPEKITLVQFDTKIRSVERVRNVRELMKVKFTGRGGTLISPVLEWANQNKPQGLLIFSDGGFRFHGTVTKVPVIWLIHNNDSWTAPFGKVVHYKI